MLFHVTATHKVDFCAAYDPELKEKLGEVWNNLGQTAEELGVKVKSWTLDAPAHKIFMTLEAESVASVSKFLLSNPMRQEYETRPVVSLDELKAMLDTLGPAAKK